MIERPSVKLRVIYCNSCTDKDIARVQQLSHFTFKFTCTERMKLALVFYFVIVGDFIPVYKLFNEWGKFSGSGDIK